jgi:hypothetical protein
VGNAVRPKILAAAEASRAVAPSEAPVAPEATTPVAETPPAVQ